MKCKECRHYCFYLMITGGPYGYSGDIPCTRCSRFSTVEDNFEPIAPQPANKADRPNRGRCKVCGSTECKAAAVWNLKS